MLQRRALVHVALVRDLARIDRRRLGQNHEAPDPPGRSAGRRVERVQRVLEFPCELFERRSGRAIGGQFLQRRRRGPKQRRGERLVLPRDHRVEHIGRARGHNVRPQRADRHPRAAVELEILCDAPIEHEPFRRIIRIDELRCITELVEALFIERRRRLLRIVVIAGRHGRAFDAHFVLRAVRHELQRHARDRQPDQTDALGDPVHHRDALRLRCAIHRRQRNPETGLLDRQRLDAIGDVGRERRAAITKRAQVFEERFAQLRVTLHRLREHAERNRRRAEAGRRNFVQILDGRLELPRQRLALVEIERAAGPQNPVEADISRRDVAPRHPVECLGHAVRRRRIRRDKPTGARDYRRHHAVRLRHAFRHPRRSRREKIFCNAVIVQPVARRRDVTRRLRFHQLAERRGAFGPIDGDEEERRIERAQRFERARKLRPALREHGFRLHRREAMLELGVVGGNQRIGRADRRDRHA